MEIISGYMKYGDAATYYLTSPSGILEKIVVENIDASVSETPLEQGEAGFQVQLDFWMKYYKKHPQLTTNSKN